MSQCHDPRPSDVLSIFWKLFASPESNDANWVTISLGSQRVTLIQVPFKYVHTKYSWANTSLIWTLKHRFSPALWLRIHISSLPIAISCLHLYFETPWHLFLNPFQFSASLQSSRPNRHYNTCKLLDLLRNHYIRWHRLKQNTMIWWVDCPIRAWVGNLSDHLSW